MRVLGTVVGGVVLWSLLACSGVDLGRKAAKVVPAVEKINPEYGTEPVDCGKPYPTPAMVGCVMDTITCGGSIEGNTAAGGAMKFGDDEYQHWYCTPQRNDYEESPEAIYALEVPADIWADITLVSDCADLDVVAIAWQDTKRCPTVANNIIECEMDTSDRGGKIHVTTVNKPQTYLLVVDGKHGAEGNFRLDVKCHTYR